MRLPLSIAVFSLGLAFINPASSSEWNLVHDEDVKVFTRTKEGARVSELRAEIEMDCAPSEARSVLIDDDYTKRTPYVSEARIVEQPSRKTKIKYTRLAFPVVNDRDYFIEGTREADLDAKGTGT